MGLIWGSPSSPALLCTSLPFTLGPPAPHVQTGPLGDGRPLTELGSPSLPVGPFPGSWGRQPCAFVGVPPGAVGVLRALVGTSFPASAGLGLLSWHHHPALDPLTTLWVWTQWAVSPGLQAAPEPHGASGANTLLSGTVGKGECQCILLK